MGFSRIHKGDLVKINISKFPVEAVKPISQMQQRARDWAPLEARLYSIVKGDMRKVQKTKSPSSTGRLDSSIQGLDIWRFRQNSIEWGTSVDYAGWVDLHRKREKLPQVRLLGPNLQRQVLDAITDYITEGRK